MTIIILFMSVSLNDLKTGNLMIQVKGLLRRKAYRHNKKLLKGRNRTTFVSATVIHTVLSPKAARVKKRSIILNAG